MAAVEEDQGQTLSDRAVKHLEIKRLGLQALMSGGTRGSLEYVAEVDIATRSVWLSLFSLAQDARPSVTAELLSSVKHELLNALEITKARECQGGADEQTMASIGLRIEARVNSLEVLLRSGSAEEFAAAGVITRRGSLPALRSR